MKPSNSDEIMKYTSLLKCWAYESTFEFLEQGIEKDLMRNCRTTSQIAYFFISSFLLYYSWMWTVHFPSISMDWFSRQNTNYSILSKRRIENYRNAWFTMCYVNDDISIKNHINKIPISIYRSWSYKCCMCNSDLIPWLMCIEFKHVQHSIFCFEISFNRILYLPEVKNVYILRWMFSKYTSKITIMKLSRLITVNFTMWIPPTKEWIFSCDVKKIATSRANL